MTVERTEDAQAVRSLRTDPRADPRMVEALAVFGLDEFAAAPEVTSRSSREDQLGLLAASETGFTQVYDALFAGLPPVEGVSSEIITIPGPDGNDIRLFVHRPDDVTGPLPCVYEIHGGGMTIMPVDGASYMRLRDELAATGLVVVGVDFRNGAGVGGVHPYPAGLEDCKAGLRWAAAHLDDLGASHIVLTGDSGGANLALAVAIAANGEGWVDEIAGVYAQCPFIHGFWSEQPDSLPSLTDNNGYFLNVDMLQVMSEVYDPGAVHRDEATCWPSRAVLEDLQGLPPHVISVNELDPMRDEGLDYFRKLLAAGVKTIGRMNLGLCHTGETMFRAAMPDLYAANVQVVSDFARSVG
jgi:acetyl esterase/lipase